jgi:serine/threonine protein kinase
VSESLFITCKRKKTYLLLITLNQMPVHEPIEFGPPVTAKGWLQPISLRVEDGRVGEVVALHSPGGAVYEFRRPLKNAIYGKVYVGNELELMGATYTRGAALVAIKVIEKRLLATTVSHEDPLKEMSVAQYLTEEDGTVHPNVMGQVEVISDETRYYIVMEFCGGGELFDVLGNQSHSRFPEGQARLYFQQLVSGVQHLHLNDVVHGDLSLENVLVTSDGFGCKIIDYGMSQRFARDENGNVMLFPPLGVRSKPYYRAPETHANQNPFLGPAADVWSLGVMLFMMIVGARPVDFPSAGCPRFCAVARGVMWDMVAGWGVTHLSVDVKDLITKMLCINPFERITLDEVREHPWMNEMQ